MKRPSNVNSLSRETCTCGRLKLRLPTKPSMRHMRIFQFRCDECSNIVTGRQLRRDLREMRALTEH